MNIANWRTTSSVRMIALLCTLGISAMPELGIAQPSIQLSRIGTYSSGVFALGAAEIVAHDPVSQRLFVVNAQAATIDVLDISTPAAPTLIGTIDVTPYGAVANSVAVHNGLVAVAVENSVKQVAGKVVFFNRNGVYLNQATVGALPDMLTFSPNGRWLLVANEGEPSGDYTVDPEGSVSIIDLNGNIANLTQSKVRTVDFRQFNNATLDSSIRVYGPNATVAKDMEPEYITISHNSKTAWVSLQENNAMAIIDIPSATITDLVGLGFKDHNLDGNDLDASDRDNGINIRNWPVLGMYLPDALASYHHHGKTYIVSANEGDAREYSAFVEEARVRDVTLDATAFPNRSTLRAVEQLGRLKITKTLGDTDNDGDYDRLYSFGARSFSIWSEDGELVFDSGDDLEQITAAALPTGFNSNNDANGSFDTRSDDKGPEPEGVTLGKIDGRTYAFIGIERIGGVAVFDVTDPNEPFFVQYVNSRDFTGNAALGTAGDLGPEGLIFIMAEDSPNGSPLLVIGNEVSGTTTIYQITETMPKRGGNEAGTTRDITLAQNAPNPFSNGTTISFTLPEVSQVVLTLVDASGSTVATLLDGTRSAGEHAVEYHPTDLLAGRYFYRLDVNGEVRAMRMLTLIR